LLKFGKKMIVEEYNLFDLCKGLIRNSSKGALLKELRKK